jgi:hypothetical protein
LQGFFRCCARWGNFFSFYFSMDVHKFFLKARP